MMRLVLAVAVLSCGACDILDPGVVRTLEVAAHKTVCFREGETLCLVAREPPDTVFRDLSPSIRDFEFEWGFEYTIQVWERPLDVGNCAGCPSTSLALKQELSREPTSPGATFDLAVYGYYLTPADSATYVLMHEVEIACTSRCSDLRQAVARGDRLALLLGFPATAGEPLPLLEWAECPMGVGACL